MNLSLCTLESCWVPRCDNCYPKTRAKILRKNRISSSSSPCSKQVQTRTWSIHIISNSKRLVKSKRECGMPPQPHPLKNQMLVLKWFAWNYFIWIIINPIKKKRHQNKFRKEPVSLQASSTLLITIQEELHFWIHRNSMPLCTCAGWQFARPDQHTRKQGLRRLLNHRAGRQ